MFGKRGDGRNAQKRLELFEEAGVICAGKGYCGGRHSWLLMLEIATAEYKLHKRRNVL
jgi:hypothetical protein